MTHPTDQERAREVAARIVRDIDADFSWNGEENAHRTGVAKGSAASAITDALLSFAPQSSLSDEVRGLIEAANESEQELRSIGSLLKRGRYDGPGYMSIPATSEHSANVIAKLREAIARLSTPPSSPVSGEGERRVRHKKRGSTYTVVGTGRMQTDTWREPDPVGAAGNTTVDMRVVVIYRSEADGKTLWVRPEDEFEDGRFEDIAPSRPPEPATSGEGGTK